jgi:hypothetical protein
MRLLQVTLLGIALACFAPACGGDDIETSGDDTTSTTDTAVEDDDDVAAAVGDDTSSVEPSDDVTEVDIASEPVPCEPACDDKTCGDDGCDGTCGACTDPATCMNGACCTPDCTESECGDDGCGGSCGTCDVGKEQCTAGACEAKTYTCPEMFDAAQESDCDWSADFAGCQASITEAQEASDEAEAVNLATLLGCLDEKGCAVTEGNAQASCQKEVCLAETASCEANQFGALLCFEITQCIQGATCPKHIESGAPTAACRRQCMEQGTEAAVAFWLNLELCGVSECFGEENYDQCVTDVSNLQCVTENSDCYDEAQQ